MPNERTELEDPRIVGWSFPIKLLCGLWVHAMPKTKQ